MGIEDNNAEDLTDKCADIVSAYVTHNALPPGQLVGLISAVYQALRSLRTPATSPMAAPAPAVSIRRSLGEDSLICLECGKRFTSLKRHIRVFHDLAPDEYRAKWKLPGDYPMVAPNYAAKRSQIALSLGLGTTSRKKPRR